MKWFQVDSDTPEDPRMRLVLRQMGSEGFGALVLLWCHVANHGARPGRSIDSSGRPLSVEDLVEASGLTEAKFLQLVTLCTQSGHFDARAWEAKREIVIPAMRRRVDTYTQRRVRTAVEQASKKRRRVCRNKTVQDKTVQKEEKQSRRAPRPGRPPADPPAANVGVLTKLAHEVLRDLGARTHPSDVAEEIKCRCARLQIAYDSEAVRKAYESALAQRELAHA